MFSMYKLLGDLIQGYSVKIAAACGGVVLAEGVYEYLSKIAQPISTALGN